MTWHTIFHQPACESLVHTLQGNDLPYNLPPYEGVELRYNLPWALHSHPDRLPPRRQSLHTPILTAAALSCPVPSMCLTNSSFDMKNGCAHSSYRNCRSSFSLFENGLRACPTSTHHCLAETERNKVLQSTSCQEKRPRRSSHVQLVMW